MSKSRSYLVHRKTGSTYFFRSVIPKDLQSKLGKREFQLSLRCGILKQDKFLSFQLFNQTQFIYASIRDNSMSKHASTEDIKESLKIELDKSRPGNLKPSGKEKTDIADGKDKTEPEKQKPSDCISLVELCEKKYPNKTIKQLVKLQDTQLVSYRTISKHAERVSALFKWEINQGYTNRNVFRGKLEPLRKTKR